MLHPAKKDLTMSESGQEYVRLTDFCACKIIRTAQEVLGQGEFMDKWRHRNV